jgi:hypothetical protein
VRLQENLADTEIEFFILDLVQRNVDLTLNGTLEVEVLGFTNHPESNLHGKL